MAMVKAATATVRRGEYQVLAVAGAVLVNSKTDAQGWHEVAGGRCDCHGYAYRGRCSHLDAVAALEVPAPIPASAARCTHTSKGRQCEAPATVGLKGSRPTCRAHDWI
ncbi:MAG: hypothetical protein NTZ05_13215 [Chloroflexi bacterium]|nr:hypothetical protein [Chloroflexota bacterium]